MLRSGPIEQFEAQLARLKESLGVTKDSEVAFALGMSKSAFSNRRQAGSFPEDKVVLLKKQRPDLDVMYVLTGERWSPTDLSMSFLDAAAYLEDLSLASSAVRAARNHSQALLDAANDPQIRELLGILIFCDRQAIVEVLILAAKLMGPKPLPFASRPPPSFELLGSDAADRATLQLEGLKSQVSRSRSATLAVAPKRASNQADGPKKARSRASKPSSGASQKP